MTEDKKEIVEVLLANRLYIYSLLHKVFGREPNSEILELLTADITGESFGLLSEKDSDVMAKAADFLSMIRSEMAGPKFIDSLKSEYNNMFVGPLKIIAPPWESIYVGKEAMLFQESTLRVRQFYRSFGMIPEGYPRVADDSLALELAFMAELASRSVKALAEGNDEELKNNVVGSSKFLEAHLLVWVPKLVEKLVDATSDILYPQMCLILDSFLKQDHAALGEIMAALEA